MALYKFRIIIIISV